MHLPIAEVDFAYRGWFWWVGGGVGGGGGGIISDIRPKSILNSNLTTSHSSITFTSVTHSFWNFAQSTAVSLQRISSNCSWTTQSGTDDEITTMVSNIYFCVNPFLTRWVHTTTVTYKGVFGAIGNEYNSYIRYWLLRGESHFSFHGDLMVSKSFGHYWIQLETVMHIPSAVI